MPCAVILLLVDENPRSVPTYHVQINAVNALLAFSGLRYRSTQPTIT